MKNYEMKQNYLAGEEGIDYIPFAPTQTNPDDINEKRLER
jgi:hypothetical protein